MGGLSTWAPTRRVPSDPTTHPHNRTLNIMKSGPDAPRQQHIYPHPPPGARHARSGAAAGLTSRWESERAQCFAAMSM